MSDQKTVKNESDTTDQTQKADHAGDAKGGSKGDLQSETATKAKPERDATRYGDWEMNGRCIDF